MLLALETEVNRPATTIIAEDKPTTAIEENCQNLKDSIADMLDSFDEDEQSQNEISDTKTNLLIEYISEKKNTMR